MTTAELLEETQANRGLVLDPIEIGKDYIFGGYGDLGGEPLQINGQWDQYLPKEESQLLGVETSACVSFGTLNALEVLARRLYQFDKNWSDRYLATVSETQPAGNSPQKVSEALRKRGVPLETEWPNDPSLNTWQKFYAPISSRTHQLAQVFVAEFEFKHEYVPTSHGALKEALKHSPLGISVPAWYEDNGVFYRPPGTPDNHWCVLYGYEDGKYWKVFDTYQVAGQGLESYRKRLAWDCLPTQAKRYVLNRQVVKESWWQIFLNWIHNQTFLPEQPSPAPLNARLRLLEAAKRHLGKEASPKDKVPDDVACVESLGNVIREVLPFPDIYGTYDALQYFKKSNQWKASLNALPGNVIINATGTGNGSMRGHCGVIGERGKIYSNHSMTGIWTDFYNLDTWRARYRIQGGMVTHIFEPLN